MRFIAPGGASGLMGIVHKATFLTVFEVDETEPVDLDWTTRPVNEYTKSDDVFRPEFLKAALPRAHAHHLLPYYYSTGTLRPVWKLYEDTHSAFLQSLVVDKKVASKLTHPLRGWRIAVKDNFQIQRIRTSAYNRAYFELYPPDSRAAVCIQKLYDAGATIVGTTKLASFAATEEPMECVDWPAPFNPRADGYQSPAGSSSGSGMAVAAYGWLDVTVGSDTSESGRRPGHWNGCFAMRPSNGYLSQERLPSSFPSRTDCCQLLLSIVYAADYMDMIRNAPQRELLDAFVADLEKTFGVKHEKVSFEEIWKTNPPSQANGASLLTYMKDASRDSFFYEGYHNFAAFRQDYKTKFGKDAYISPPVRRQWELSSHISASSHAEAMLKVEVCKTWFEEVITKPSKQNTLVFIPIEEIAPRYRDEMPTAHFNPVGVPNLFLSPILKAPELTVPIGEVAYSSKVSDNEEKLPVAVSVIGPPGQDLFLFDLVMKCPQNSNRPDRVLAGRKLFPDAESIE
ncbi:amidase signature enzyme [Ophiobolus disseminans]|uniref:Amidase signature enzyme n=1 Tax=Ophiobolus disseminans TaxID=1469910 RepID=A0A6A7AD94_9PLEO|nr:amidase signature enzyme [Ophiobolus disseminans]